MPHDGSAATRSDGSRPARDEERAWKGDSKTVGEWMDQLARLGKQGLCETQLPRLLFAKCGVRESIDALAR